MALHTSLANATAATRSSNTATRMGALGGMHNSIHQCFAQGCGRNSGTYRRRTRPILVPSRVFRWPKVTASSSAVTDNLSGSLGRRVRAHPYPQTDRPGSRRPDTSITAPLRHVDGSPTREFEWTRPKRLTQIRFVEPTANGRLRHAAFLGNAIGEACWRGTSEALSFGSG